MHILKKIFLFIALAAVFFWNVGCTLNPGEADDNDNTPPVISTPSDDDDKPVVTDPQDNVTFVNKTDLMVKIFSDSLKTTLLTEINYGEKFSCKADVNTVGNVFYYTYYLALDKVLVPYGTGQSIVNLSTDKSTIVNIVDPTEINTNKNIVILKNLSSSAISLGYSTSELLAENMTSTLLNQDEYGIYLLDFSNNLADYKIFDAGKNINLSETPTEEKGYIYYFDYTGKEVVLNSKTFFNKDLKNKIWKISLSQETGKTLWAGHFTTRKKSENGYMLYASQIYNNDNAISYDNCIPYYAFINPNGDISEEQTLKFYNKPQSATSVHSIDTGKYILTIGEQTSSKNITSAFIMGIKGLSVYKSIYNGDEKTLVTVDSIVQKTDNTFCVLISKDKFSIPIYNSDNYLATNLALIEVTIDDYTSFSSKILWENNEYDLSPYGLIYDESSDTYIILAYDGKSKILFIDGTSGTEKTNSIIFENYDFEKIKKGTDGNVFLIGGFINQLTLSREACVMEIDISTGTLVDSIPKTFPAKDKNLNSYFHDIVFEDNYVIYAGCTDYGINGNFDDSIPYIVAYDTAKDKILWERRFDDMKGYYVFSCSDTDISFVYELYNETTCHSYIVSAGILGEIPEEIKLTLPQSTSIKEVEAPDATVYFYENYEAVEEGNYYNETTFKCNSEITLEDLAEYAPADIPAGYTVTGWYKWNTDTEDEPITFPYTIEENSYFYPKLEQGKTDINCDASKLAETIAGLSAGEYKIIVSGIMTSDILAAVRTAMIDNESAKINLDLSGTTGLTTISDFAFQNCGNLISIIIPESVTKIDYKAFFECANLTSITIPDSVTEIKQSAFWDCDKLTTINITENNENYSTSEDGKILYNKDKTYLITYPSAAGDIAISEGVTFIADNAFAYCDNLTSVTIPESVFYVDGYAFLDCDNLASVTFEDTKNWYYTSTYGGTKEIDVTDPTQNATDFKSGKYNDKYLIKTANVYSYKLNIEDISGTWGGTTKSPMFSIIFMTDEQVEASKNYGDFNFSSQAYQLYSYGNIKIADTNQTGNYAVYGSLPVDNEYQYYTGVAATVTDTTFELLLDVSKLKKTEIKWFNSENASGETLTDSDTLDLINYKPYVIALGTEINDPDNYVMTVWGADVMTMTPSTTSFPTDLEYAAPKVAVVGDIAYSDGSTSADYNSTKSAVGIVIEVTSGAATKIVSLTETSAKWSTEYVITNATSETDGMANMTAIQSITGWKDKYPAFKWCDDYTDEAGNSEWYLPAKDELNLIFMAKDVINTAIEKITVGGGTATSLAEFWLWSSSQSNDYRDSDYRAWGLWVIDDFLNLDIGEKDYTDSVRAVRAF